MRCESKSLGQEDPLEEGMTTHSSILALKIPWTEEPGGLQSFGCKRVRHDRVIEQQQQQYNYRNQLQLTTFYPLQLP